MTGTTVMIGSAARTDIPYGPSQRPWSESVSPFAVSADGKFLVSPPSRNQQDLTSYPLKPGITNSLYQIPSSGLSQKEKNRALKELETYLEKAGTNYVGFQANLQHKDCAVVMPFLQGDFIIVNSGNPFVTGAHHLDSLMMERNVLDYYGMPSGLMIPMIQNHIGDMYLPWDLLKVLCRQYGMPVTTFVVM